MTEFIYKFYTDSDKEYEVWECDLTSDKEVEEFVENSYILIGKEEVSNENYVVGWCYYNDEEDYKEACEYVFNNEVQLDNYIDNKNAGGHFVCDRIDFYEDGVLIRTEMVAERISTMNDWGLNPNPGDNLD